MRNVIATTDLVVVRLTEPAQTSFAWVMDRPRVMSDRTGTHGT